MNEKTAQLNNKFILSLLIIFFCFLLDRVSKIYVIKFYLNNQFKDYYVNKFLNFSLVWNKGIAFGIFQSESIIYHFITFIILSIIIFVCYLIVKSKSFFEIICLSMIAGGAIGNLFDRIYYKSVPDFIDLHYGNFHWFTFNVSDICITIGIVLLLIFDTIKFKNRDKNG